MLQHHVFIRFVPGTSDAHIAELCSRLLALREAVPGIEHMEIGRDELHEARSWDLMLTMRFASVEALRVYQKHPAHLAVMAFDQPCSAEAGAIDFHL